MLRVVLALGCLAVAVGGCATDDAGGDGGRRVVVTTSILGDIVESLGTDADVEVLLPLGADPHDFEVSTRQAEAMAEAALLVVHGAGFEGGLQDAIDAAGDAGAEVFDVSDHVDLLDDDPHVWFDPIRMIPAIEALGEALEASGTAAYVAQVRDLDAELESTLATVPPDRRVLVTNHDVLAYFADRYGFEVVGAVIPSTTTGAQPSASDLDELAEVIRTHAVPAIFGETSNPADLAEALAEEVGGEVDVVELYTESLGEPGSGAETYLGMLRIDAIRIAGTLS